MTETEQDKMLLIKILHEKMNWSFRRIGRMFSQSKDTISAIYTSALEQSEDEKLANLPKSRKSIDLRYVGDTSDVEWIEGDINHNVCGGGRKVNNEQRRDA